MLWFYLRLHNVYCIPSSSMLCKSFDFNVSRTNPGAKSSCRRDFLLIWSLLSCFLTSNFTSERSRHCSRFNLCFIFKHFRSTSFLYTPLNAPLWHSDCLLYAPDPHSSSIIIWLSVAQKPWNQVIKANIPWIWVIKEANPVGLGYILPLFPGTSSSKKPWFWVIKEAGIPWNQVIKYPFLT